MRALLDGDLFDLRRTCGIAVPSKTLKFKDLPELIRSFCLHFLLYSAKSELDQIIEGLTILWPPNCDAEAFHTFFATILGELSPEAYV